MGGVADLGFARVDTHRGLRTGDPEVVYAGGKSTDQTVAILRELVEQGGTPTGDRDPAAGERRPMPSGPPSPTRWSTTSPDARRSARCPSRAAGSSSSRPARRTHRLPPRRRSSRGRSVREVDRVDDVGVAGMHRLLSVRESLDAADCLVVVAGMEGALPSVVGGLTGVPLVAVPTSVGYGTSYGGLAALLAMLNSCAPGVVVCNIDNGFGAGVFAARVARRAAVA